MGNQFDPSGKCKRGQRRDELLEDAQFSMLDKSQQLIGRLRLRYNAVRPHPSLGYLPPAPETILPPAFALIDAALRPA